ncbi:type II toxin-antitoxin system RelE/ParE family toxin [Palleronia caenipelagi]|uniref:Type II toxin-antitoxin system RelE/ParE family toxin n=1 Tax=Palleronia caenipelagi TaxID=2489174 RepID=A0A547PPQ6_9RHOB|nr:type II toxin-antitoxin system RelE/ParE family toxin [Palleronia caenipelagi]TRD16126.1 type II toxin-antitoxin system RelE/ParE family toxin [Palleronia caenipelagi]
MRLLRHPLVERDLIGIADHIVETTEGDIAAAERRLDEVDALVADILSNPLSGTCLHGDLEGWLVRHGGRGHRLTIVFRTDVDAETLFMALIAFGGRNWTELAPMRSVWAASLENSGTTGAGTRKR